MGKAAEATRAKTKAAAKKKLDKMQGKEAYEIDGPAPSGPLSKEIALLVARRHAIQKNQSRATQSMRDHQARLDKAESESAELSVRNMADPSPTNQQLASDARVHRNVVLQEFDMAKHDLQLIPGALEKLKRDIETLQGKKRIEEKALITSEIPDISEYREAAIEALARYAAHVCLTTERQVRYVDAKEVSKGLDKHKELTSRYEKVYLELEASMNFERL